MAHTSPTSTSSPSAHARSPAINSSATTYTGSTTSSPHPHDIPSYSDPLLGNYAFPPMSSGAGPVIAEVEMNAGTDQDATTVQPTVVQACSMLYDTPATLDKAEKLTAEAAGYGSQLVLFPEVFLGGYPHGSAFGPTVGSRSAKGKEDFWKYHASAIDVPVDGVHWILYSKSSQQSIVVKRVNMSMQLLLIPLIKMNKPTEHTSVCPGGSSIISPSRAVFAGPNYEGGYLLRAGLASDQEAARLSAEFMPPMTSTIITAPPLKARRSELEIQT